MALFPSRQAGVGEFASVSVHSVLATEPWQCAAENERSFFGGLFTSAPESATLRRVADSTVNVTTDCSRMTERTNSFWIGIGVSIGSS